MTKRGNEDKKGGAQRSRWSRATKPLVLPNEDIFALIADLNQKLITNTAPVPVDMWDKEDFQFEHLLKRSALESSSRSALKNGREIRHYISDIAVRILLRAENDEERQTWLSEMREKTKVKGFSFEDTRDYLQAHNKIGRYVDAYKLDILYVDLKHSLVRLYLADKINDEQWLDMNNLLGYETPMFFELAEVLNISNFNVQRFFDSSMEKDTHFDIDDVPSLNKISCRKENLKQFLERAPEGLALALLEHWEGTSAKGKEYELLWEITPDKYKPAGEVQKLQEPVKVDTVLKKGGTSMLDKENEVMAAPLDTTAQGLDMRKRTKAKLFFTSYLDDEDFLKIDLNRAILLKFLKDLTPPLSEFKDKIPQIADFINRVQKDSGWDKNEHLYWLTPWLDTSFKKIVAGDVKGGMDDFMVLKSIADDFSTKYMEDAFLHIDRFSSDSTKAFEELEGHYADEANSKESRAAADSFAIKITMKKEDKEPFLLTDYIGAEISEELSPQKVREMLPRLGLIPPVTDFNYQSSDMADFLEKLPKGKNTRILHHWTALGVKDMMAGEVEKGLEQIKAVVELDSAFYGKVAPLYASVVKKTPLDMRKKITEYAKEHPEDMKLLQLYIASFRGSANPEKKAVVKKVENTAGFEDLSEPKVRVFVTPPPIATPTPQSKPVKEGVKPAAVNSGVKEVTAKYVLGELVERLCDELESPSLMVKKNALETLKTLLASKYGAEVDKMIKGRQGTAKELNREISRIFSFKTNEGR